MAHGEILKKFRIWKDKLNLQQKIIVAVLVPTGLFILFYPIAYTRVKDKYSYSERFEISVFNFEYSWFVWLIYVVVTGVFLFYLFETKIIETHAEEENLEIVEDDE